MKEEIRFLYPINLILVILSSLYYAWTLGADTLPRVVERLLG